MIESVVHHQRINTLPTISPTLDLVRLLHFCQSDECAVTFYQVLICVFFDC